MFSPLYFLELFLGWFLSEFQTWAECSYTQGRLPRTIIHNIILRDLNKIHTALTDNFNDFAGVLKSFGLEFLG